MSISSTIKKFSKRWDGDIEYRTQTSRDFEGNLTWSAWTVLEGYLEEDSEQANSNNDRVQEIEYNSVIITLTEFNNNIKTEIRLFGDDTQKSVLKDVRRDRTSKNVTVYSLIF